MTERNRGIVIAGNWKMNHGLKETREFFSAVNSGLKELPEKLQAIVFPPMLSISEAIKESQGSAVQIGPQNGHWEESGAFTGELSGKMILEQGMKWVLVGHSERRQYFGETDETVHQRTSSLLKQGLNVMLCIGETQSERENQKTTEVLLRQLEIGLPKDASFFDGRLVLAYEPVWAIGTGLTATPAQAEEAHQIIRKSLWDRFGMEASARTPILYGGSVKPANIDELLACPNVDGGLVGGASLKPDSYLALVEAGRRALAG